MGAILQAKVKVRGTRPLFQCKFGPDALPLERQEREGVAGNSPNEWRKTAMLTREGQLYIEPTYIFGAMREAARYVKQGKASAQRPVQATLQVLDERILLDRYYPGFPNGHTFDIKAVEPPSTDSDEDVYLDVRGVRNPATKAMNVRYRLATRSGWECSFTLQWDATVVDRAVMREILANAGRLMGLGNGRTIGMGRFEVVDYQIVE